MKLSILALCALSATAVAAPLGNETPELDNNKTAYCVQMLVRQGPSTETATYTVVSQRCWVGSLPTFSPSDGTAAPSLAERKSKN